MRLKEVQSLSASVERDGTFSSLGFLSHSRKEMLVYVTTAEYLRELEQKGNVSCVITTRAFAATVSAALGLVVVDDPRQTFFMLHNYLAKETSFYGAPFPTRIAHTARIHDTAFVSPTSVVIGNEVEIGPRAVVLSGVEIGDGSVIRAGAVLGSEGFQVYFNGGECFRVAHAGVVRIGRRVDIHSNTCVDRSVFAETLIGDDTTIDNLVHVAHDVSIGQGCRIVALAVLGGSSRIGDGAWIGPSAVVSSGVTVGANALVSLGSVVTRNVPDAARVSGNFAIDHDRFLSFLKSIR